jgi:hypothetical protein
MKGQRTLPLPCQLPRSSVRFVRGVRRGFQGFRHVKRDVTVMSVILIIELIDWVSSYLGGAWVVVG